MKYPCFSLFFLCFKCVLSGFFYRNEGTLAENREKLRKKIKSQVELIEIVERMRFWKIINAQKKMFSAKMFFKKEKRKEKNVFLKKELKGTLGRFAPSLKGEKLGKVGALRARYARAEMRGRAHICLFMQELFFGEYVFASPFEGFPCSLLKKASPRYNMFMAFVRYVDINPADEQKFFGGLTPDSQFLYSKIKKKTSLFSAKKKKSLLLRSLLPQISELWAGLTTEQKNLWTTCGAYSSLNGWRTFVAEQSIRIKLGLSVPNTPSIYHNAWFGHLAIGGSAMQIKIAQYHPAGYYVRQKVYGVKGLYAPVFVQEPMSLPLTIGLSYCCDLTPTGATQYAKFYAVVRSSYQGVDRENLVEIDLINNSEWHIETAILSETLGYVIGYTLYIHIFGYTGDFYFDHVKAIHGAVNWARDKNCYDINVAFTNQYYQIPKHWVALELPSGAVYDSDYIDGI